MTQHGIRSTQRPATPEERRRLEAYREQVARDAPELQREARETEAAMRAAAADEPSVSGQLRRAIAASGLDRGELADQAGLSPKTLAEFLIGRATLDSSAIDQLATLLRQELKPIG